MTKSIVKVDHAFAMIPEWVLYADISANAVRLYGVLRRFADQNSGECWPSRRLLGERCKVSPATVDRALEELVEAGAVTVKGRVTDRGDRTSNLYTVLSVPNSPPVNAGGSPTNHPLSTGDQTPLLTGDEGTRASNNESQKNDTYATAKAIAKAWWDSRPKKPMGSYVGLVKIVQRAVDAEWTNQQIETALATFNAVPAVWALEAALNGAAKNTPTLSERDNRVMEILAMARAEREKGMNDEG